MVGPRAGVESGAGEVVGAGPGDRATDGQEIGDPGPGTKKLGLGILDPDILPWQGLD